ncbi:MAG: molybdopterin cofactor-binding domain-containing protein [Pseudomonadota bacterium]
MGIGTIARRTFLFGSAAVAGGFAVGYWAYKEPFENPLLDTLEPGQVAITPYVKIDAAGITLVSPRSEMGQGVMTTLAALVAEELDVDLADVAVEHAPASKAYYNQLLMDEAAGQPVTDNSASAEFARDAMRVISRFLGNQGTGGSTSTPDSFVKLRKAGAGARAVLIKAAAREMGVPARSLKTDNGSVVAPDGTRLAYTALAAAAAKESVPSDPDLKPQSEWKILGKSQRRVDMVAKATGTAEFGIDVQLPDMLYATVKMNCHIGSGIRSFDLNGVDERPEVKRVIALDHGLAIVATNTWYAFRAAQDIMVDWEGPSYPKSQDEITASIYQAFDTEYDSRLRDDGDIETALSDGEIVSGTYQVPYLAHATMEPMNATGWYKDGELDIWTGTQAPTMARTMVAEETGLPESKIRIHTTYLGGGFGRRSETDFVKQAARIAMAMEGTPIKMTWSREEDMCHDQYRPLSAAKFSGCVKDGRIDAFDLQVSSSPTAIDGFSRRGMNLNIPDPTIVQNAWDNPYEIANYRVTGYRAPIALPLGFWRSVGASKCGFFQEAAIDEVIHAAGLDPVEARLQLLSHEPSRKVVEAVAAMSNWGSPLPDGHGRGVAFYLSFGVPSAQVFEVANTPYGIRLVNIWAAVDVGTALDPRNIEAQVQSGIIYGLSAAIKGEITVVDGRVSQSNFHDYDGLRLRETPPIHVAVLENGEKIRGIGEPGTPPAAPALTNAIFAATGQRIRALPLANHIAFA